MGRRNDPRAAQAYARRWLVAPVAVHGICVDNFVGKLRRIAVIGCWRLIFVLTFLKRYLDLLYENQ